MPDRRVSAVGRLIVIEGVDGSGKRTLTARLAAEITASGGRVRSLAFPRYGRSVHADLIRDVLYGRLGDLSESVYGTALLFALDRWGAKDEIEAALDDHDVVLLDRYVSSNAAYGSARLGAHFDHRAAADVDREAGEFREWLREIEFGRFGIPVPDRQLLLATEVMLAGERAAQRAGADADRALDRFECDTALQRRTAEVYRSLAEQSYLSPWTVLEPGPDGRIDIPAGTIEAG